MRLYDINPKATDKLESNLRSAPGLKDISIVRTSTIQEAASGADIITTPTADQRTADILTPSLVRPGTHLNAVGGDGPGKTELHRDLLAHAGTRIVIEFEPRSRIEGDIQQMPPEFPVIEFAQVVSGKQRGSSFVL